MVKRAYFVHRKEEDEGIAVVASSAKEAKKLCFYYSDMFYSDEWIELRVKWLRDAYIDDLPVGHIFDDSRFVDGLFRHIYNSVEHGICPSCGVEDTAVFEMYDNVFGCFNCEGELSKDDVNNPYVEELNKER